MAIHSLFPSIDTTFRGFLETYRKCTNPHFVSSLSKCSAFLVRLSEFSRNKIMATINCRVTRTDSEPLAGIWRWVGWELDIRDDGWSSDRGINASSPLGFVVEMGEREKGREVEYEQQADKDRRTCHHGGDGQEHRDRPGDDLKWLGVHGQVNSVHGRTTVAAFCYEIRHLAGCTKQFLTSNTMCCLTIPGWLKWRQTNTRNREMTNTSSRHMRTAHTQLKCCSCIIR